VNLYLLITVLIICSGIIRMAMRRGAVDQLLAILFFWNGSFFLMYFLSIANHGPEGVVFGLYSMVPIILMLILLLGQFVFLHEEKKSLKTDIFERDE